MRYWLFKTEPECYSLADLSAAPQKITSWDGVRNYQARNFMREMRKGDLGFFYNSGKTPEIVGIVEVVREAYPDSTAFDTSNSHYDPLSTQENPRWYMVDVQLVRVFSTPIPRSMLRQEPELANMELMRKGSRLSVQPVEETAFKHILHIADSIA